MSEAAWTERAANDLESVIEFFAKNSVAYAEQLHGRVMAKVRMLSHSPRLGRSVPEFADENIRELIVPPLRVIYVLREGACTIARIMHSSRDLPGWIRPEE